MIWAAIGADPPPKMSLRLVIQSQDAESAKALRPLIPRLVDVAVFEPLGDPKSLRKLVPNLKAILAMLTPAAERDRLTLKLDGKQIDTVILDLLVPPLRDAGARAAVNFSRNNLRAIGKAIARYRADNKGAPPPDLRSLVARGLIREGMLNSPATRRPYVYIRLPEKADPGLIVAYDDYAEHAGPKTAVLFNDGRAELAPINKDLRDLVTKSKAVSQNAYGKGAGGRNQ